MQKVTQQPSYSQLNYSLKDSQNSGCLAGSVSKHVILDSGVISSSPILGVEII